MYRTRKLIEQWNSDEAIWRRYQELRLELRKTSFDVLTDEEIDDWAWSQAMRERAALDCVGFKIDGATK